MNRENLEIEIIYFFAVKLMLQNFFTIAVNIFVVGYSLVNFIKPKYKCSRYFTFVVNREKEEISYSYYSIEHDIIYRDTTLEIQNPLKHELMGLMNIHIIVHNIPPWMYIKKIFPKHIRCYLIKNFTRKTQWEKPW